MSMARELQCKKEYPVQQKIRKINVYFLISSGSKDMYCADQIFSLRCCHAIANIQTKFYGILVELIWNDPSESVLALSM